MKVASLVLFLLVPAIGVTQSSLDSLLRVIRENNYELKALQKQEEWQGAVYGTDRFLPDPVVEYDYLFGGRSAGGNQVDFTVTQAFDFPTVYRRKQALAQQQKLQQKIEYQLAAQERMLGVKLLLLEKIYLNKRQAALNRRTLEAAALLHQYNRKLSLGEGTILERNKAQVFLFGVRKDSALNETALQSAVLRLQEANGGKSFHFPDTVYPAAPALHPFAVMDSIIEAEDIAPQLYQNELHILQQQIRVQKALNLPRFELGYHSQSILHQGYKGVHFSITVPINEKRNKLKAARSHLQYEQFKHDQHRVEHRLHNQALYEELVARRSNLEAYQKLMSELQSERLFQKALQLGELTISDYLKEKDELFTVQDDHLKAELAFYQALASLYRFQLDC